MRVDPAAQTENLAESGSGAAEQAGASTRRGVLAGAGLVGLAGLAAACGSGGDSDGGGGGDFTEGSAAISGQSLGQASEIPVGGGKIFADQKVVVTQPTQGDFKAFSAVCTHAGCAVGSVSGGTINCPCHGSKFKIADGSPAGGPAKEPLAAQQVKVEGGNITLA